MTRLVLFASAILVTLALSPAPLAAQSADDIARAEKLNEEGKRKAQTIDFAGAAESFRAAIALSPDPRYYVNLCTTLEQLGQLREARSACEAAAADGRDARLTGKAKDIIARIDRALAGQPAGQAPAQSSAPTGVGFGAPTGAVQPPTGPEARPPLTWVVQLGAGIADFTFTDLQGQDIDFDSVTAVSLGVGAYYWLGALAIQLELLGSQRGASGFFDFDPGPAENIQAASFDFTYLDIVTALRFEPAHGRIRPFGFGGLYTGFNAAAEINGEVDTGELAVSTFDFGAIAGGGAVFGGFHRAFTIDVRIQLGLLDISDDATNVKHRAFQLVGGYVF